MTSAYGLTNDPGDGSGFGAGLVVYGVSGGDGWGEGSAYGEMMLEPRAGYCAGYGDGYAYGCCRWGDGKAYGESLNDGTCGLPAGTEGLELWRQYVALAPLTPQQVLSLQNVELRRIAIEVKGPDWLFSAAAAQVVHEDVDGHGHPRQLLRLEMNGTIAGYLQAVKVVCPTTGRVYHLGVPPTVRTCQEAVASTFGLKPEEYRPVRES